MMRFDRFTERALDAATRSYEILQRYSHNQVDTEHMLLALLEQPEGVIPQVLEKLGVNIETVKRMSTSRPSTSSWLSPANEAPQWLAFWATTALPKTASTKPSKKCAAANG
jgi:ATP-dependent Clp protease ATP-binding subunit ClpA